MTNTAIDLTKAIESGLIECRDWFNLCLEKIYDYKIKHGKDPNIQWAALWYLDKRIENACNESAQTDYACLLVIEQLKTDLKETVRQLANLK